MTDTSSVYITYATGALSLVWLLFKGIEYRAFKSTLDRIPTMGYSGVLTSYISGFKSLKHTPEIMLEGYEKFNSGLFKIPRLNDWLVVVSDPKMLEEVKRAPDEQISFRESTRELIQANYTYGKSAHDDPFHAEVIKSALTRNISSTFPAVRDEAVAAFETMVPVTDDWIKVPAMDTALDIVCRTSNRIFVGLPLCRDPDYKDLNIQFTIKVVVTSGTINLFPDFLKPLVGKPLSRVAEKDIQRAIRHLRPMIEERLAKIEQYGRDYPDKPSDFLSWLIDEAKTSDRRSVRAITIQLLATNFAAIHTTSMGFTTILYHLAAHPEHVKELREEVESVIAEYGWTKTGMQQMRKLDSFMKEAQRHHSTSGAAVMIRKVMKDFAFSDGTVVPAGTKIAIAADAIHHDESLYSDANEFKAFRFSDIRAEGEGFKQQMVNLGSDYLVFGCGRHACPGRFFAVNEIKAFLAHILLTYDVKMEDGKVPPLEWFGTSSSPNRSAQVMFRKRRT